MSFLNFFISLLGFSFIIFFHELGHFLFCRLFGIHVEVFSVGFGGEIFSYVDKYKTKWTLGWIPLGGYIQPLESGQLESGVDEENKTIEPKEGERSLDDVHHFKAIIVAFAGPAFNFILAFLLMWGVFVSKGTPQMKYEVVFVETGSTADLNGFKSGDQLLPSNEVAFSSKQDIRKIRNAQIIRFLRKNKVMKKKIVLEDGMALEGLQFRYSYQPVGFGQSFLASFLFVLKCILETFVGVFLMLQALMFKMFGMSSPVSGQVSGTVGILTGLTRALAIGFVDFLVFISSLSISLGVCNLIPIPMLDGGQICIKVFEWLFGTRLEGRLRDVLVVFSLVVMVLLFAISTFFDIKNVFL